MLKILLFIIGTIFTLGLVFWLIGERGRLMRKSTWTTLRALGIRRIFKLDALHLYIYGRWPNKYIGILINHIFPRLNEQGKKWWRDRYHGKVLNHELAEAIVMLNHDVAHHDLEQIIPFQIARSLVLEASPAIAAYECGCRHARKNPCQPTRVCMIIGQPLVDFILEHHPRQSQLLNRTEALELLRAAHERGHVHSAWFKDIAFNRFYCICNCCKCCCGGIEAMIKYDNPMMASSGYIARIDANKCNGCGICIKACPFNALSKNKISTLDWNKCMGCEVCVSQCKTGAISLIRDESKGIPLDIRLLKE